MYDIIHGIEDDEMILEAKAKAAEYDRMLNEAAEAEAPPCHEEQAEAPEETNDGGNEQ